MYLQGMVASTNVFFYHLNERKRVKENTGNFAQKRYAWGGNILECNGIISEKLGIKEYILHSCLK